jgi:hypothetical protein
MDIKITPLKMKNPALLRGLFMVNWLGFGDDLSGTG